MKLYEVLDGTREYTTFEEASTDLAEAVMEVQELEKSRNDYLEETERLREENARLRERNLELLTMVRVDTEEKEEETEETETLTINDLYKEV